MSELVMSVLKDKHFCQGFKSSNTNASKTVFPMFYNYWYSEQLQLILMNIEREEESQEKLRCTGTTQDRLGKKFVVAQIDICGQEMEDGASHKNVPFIFKNI